MVIHPRSPRSVWRGLGPLLGLTFGLCAPPLARGQAPSESQRARTKWRTRATLRAALAADNNVFRLSDSLKHRLDTVTIAGAPGTRFAGMAAATDYITVVRGGLAGVGPGLAGRPLSVRLRAQYDLYAHNAKRNNIALGFSVAQSLPLHGRLQLRGALVPSSFSGNYLADAVDLNGDGLIVADERRYATGSHRDTRLLLGWRQSLIRPGDGSPLGVTLKLDAGRIARTYQTPFSYRSYAGPIVRMALAFDLTRSFALDVGYARSSLRSTPDSAVLLLSETDFNRDFNGNGKLDAGSVRTLQLVDFSRAEQYLDVGVRVQAAQHLTARAWYRQRWRRFPSTEPFDVLNRARRDRRTTVGAGLTYSLTSRIQLSAAADFEIQQRRSSLFTSVVGGITDYSRTRVFLGLGYRF